MFDKKSNTEAISKEIKSLLETADKFLFQTDEFALNMKEALLSLSTNN